MEGEPWFGDLVILVGPTAVGKTAVGISLAELLGGEVLSIDARQIYKRLEIGTAKPTPEECSRVRHHLVDLYEPHERVTAAEFAEHFRAAARDVWGRGRRSLVVGGSGLYLDACLGVLDAMPPADPVIRAEHENVRQGDGVEALRDRLRGLDPASAARIAPADFKRISRALEVCELTGRPFSEQQRRFGPLDLSDGPPLILLVREREMLYARIAARSQAMIDEGLLDEIRGLLDAGISRESPAFEAIGYTEFAGVLSGEIELAAACEDLIRKTRRYAKRQLTWFRNRYTGVREVLIPEGEPAEETAARIARTLPPLMRS